MAGDTQNEMLVADESERALKSLRLTQMALFTSIPLIAVAILAALRQDMPKLAINCTGIRS